MLRRQQELEQLHNVEGEKQFHEARTNFMKEMVQKSEGMATKDKFKLLDRLIRIKEKVEEIDEKKKADKGKAIATKFIEQLKSSVWVKREAKKNDVDSEMMSRLQSVFMHAPNKPDEYEVESAGSPLLTNTDVRSPSKDFSSRFILTQAFSPRRNYQVSTVNLNDLDEPISAGVRSPAKRITTKPSLKSNNEFGAVPKISDRVLKHASSIPELPEMSDQDKERYFRKKATRMTRIIPAVIDEEILLESKSQINKLNKFDPITPIRDKPILSFPISPVFSEAKRLGAETPQRKKTIYSNLSPKVQAHKTASISQTASPRKTKQSLFSLVPQLLAAHRKNKLGLTINPRNNNGGSLSTKSLGMRYLRLLKEKNIDVNERTEEVAIPLMNKIGEIQTILSDRLNSGKLKQLKVKVHEDFVEDTLNKIKVEQANDSAKAMNDALNGERHKRCVGDTREDKKYQNVMSSGVVRIRQNRNKYFYEVGRG